MGTLPTPLPGWLTHRSEWQVVEQDIDMLGHLNNVAAMDFFERARWQMITERGYGLDVVRETQQAPVIIAVDVQFRREVMLRQRVFIDTYTTALSNRTGSVTQVMRATDETPHIIATYTIGLFDLTTRKLIPPTPAWRRATGSEEAGATR